MSWDPATWYIGWLGEMRPLLAPEVGLTNTEERFGGVHQGLNGARTMDTLGTRMRYDMSFKYLTNDELSFVRALYTQSIPGPHYLINPMHKNLLSSQASLTIPNSISDIGVYVNPGILREYANDYPSGLYVTGQRCLKVTTSNALNTYIRFDGTTKFTPWQAGETMTFSLYMRADAPVSVNFVGDTVDKNNVTAATAATQVKNVTTSWARYSMTVTQSGVMAGLRPAIVFPTVSTYNVYMAAPQLEVGAVATSFRFGGGSSKILIDQITSTSPRFPLNEVDLTILEA